MREFVEKIIREAGALGKSYFEKAEFSVSTKAHRADFLTDADTAVSDYFVHAISQAYPEHGIMTEELDTPIRPDAEYQWVIDPIDGTMNFKLGIHLWCILVALLKDGEPVLAAAYDPMSHQLYIAEEGKGTTFNGQQVHVNDHAHIDRTMGFFHVGPDNPTHPTYSKLFADMTAAGSRALNPRTRFLSCKVSSGEIVYSISNS